MIWLAGAWGAVKVRGGGALGGACRLCRAPWGAFLPPPETYGGRHQALVRLKPRAGLPRVPSRTTREHRDSSRLSVLAPGLPVASCPCLRSTPAGEPRSVGQDRNQPQPERISYDRLIKAALQRRYPELAAWLLGERPEEVSTVDTTLATAATRFTDKLLSVKLRGKHPFLLHVEFQLEGDPEMPLRMAQYLTLLLSLLKTPEHQDKQLASTVVYLDRESYHEDPGFLEVQGGLGLRIIVSYKVVKLWEVDPEPILAMEAPGLWPLVPLMDGNPIELVVKSTNRILGAPDDLASPEAKRELLAVLSGLASRVVRERALLNRLVTEILRMGKNYVFERFVNEGWVRGLEEGRREGTRGGVLRVLRRRFGQVSEPLSRRLEGIDSLDELERLVEEAAVAPSLEAFVPLLPEPRGES